MAISMHDAVGEIITLTAGFGDTKAHTALSRCHANRSYSAAANRVKVLMESIRTTESMEHDDKYRLGWLIAAVDALQRGDAPPDWVEPEPDDLFVSLREAIREAGPSVVAARSGVDASIISRYLSGKQDARGATLSRLMVAMGFELVRRA